MRAFPREDDSEGDVETWRILSEKVGIFVEIYYYFKSINEKESERFMVFHRLMRGVCDFRVFLRTGALQIGAAKISVRGRKVLRAQQKVNDSGCCTYSNLLFDTTLRAQVCVWSAACKVLVVSAESWEEAGSAGEDQEEDG